MNNGPTNVLVTGGAGFIGSELCRQLVDQGHAVTVVDNLVNGKRENLSDLPSDGLRLLVRDIRDREAMNEAVKGMKVIFHLACLGVRHSLHAPLENHAVNATASLELVRLAHREGVGRFVYVSSSEVYGTARQVPMSEQHPTWPMTVYGASKLAGEHYARAFFETEAYPTVMVRPFNAFGPRCHHEGDSGEVIPKFLLRSMANKPMVVFGDGNQTRDFTYVSDTARGILLAGFRPDIAGLTLNLGSNREISINDLARIVARVAGRPETGIHYDDPRPGDVLRLFSDSGLARERLGFSPATPLEDGLMRLKEWYQAQKRTPEELLEQEFVHNWRPKDSS